MAMLKLLSDASEPALYGHRQSWDELRHGSFHKAFAAIFSPNRYDSVEIAGYSWGSSGQKWTWTEEGGLVISFDLTVGDLQCPPKTDAWLERVRAAARGFVSATFTREVTCEFGKKLLSGGGLSFTVASAILGHHVPAVRGKHYGFTPLSITMAVTQHEAPTTLETDDDKGWFARSIARAVNDASELPVAMVWEGSYGGFRLETTSLAGIARDGSGCFEARHAALSEIEHSGDLDEIRSDVARLNGKRMDVAFGQQSYEVTISIKKADYTQSGDEDEEQVRAVVVVRYTLRLK